MAAILGIFMRQTSNSGHYVEGLDRNTFAQDKKTQQAVILNLILIGEEATKILKENEAFTL